MQDRPASRSATPPKARVVSLAAMRLMLGVFGLILLAGFAYVGFEIYRRATDPDYRAVMEHGGPVDPIELTLTPPPGGQIKSVLAVGNRLVIQVGADQPSSERLYVFDPLRGRITATISLSADEPTDPQVITRTAQ